MDFRRFTESLLTKSPISTSNDLKQKSRVFLKNSSELFKSNTIIRNSIFNRSDSEAGKEISNLIWAVSSHISLSEFKVVISKSYGNYKEFCDVLSEICCSFQCFCVCCFLYRNNEYCGYLRSIEEFNKLNYLSSNPPVHLKKMIDRQGNHLCICLVIALGLYPNIIKCYCYLHYMKLDVFYVSKRRFDKCTRVSSFYFGRAQAFLVIIDLVFQISKRICWLRYGCPCFCRKPLNTNYQFYISLILFICHLIENIFEEDETTADSIKSLSALTVDLYPICVSNEGGSNEPVILPGVKGLLRMGLVVGSSARIVIDSSMSQCIISLKSMALAVQFNKNSFTLFYQKFSDLAFTLGNGKSYLVMNTLMGTSIYLSKKYLKICGGGGEKAMTENDCCNKEQVGKRILTICMNLTIKRIGIKSYQIFNDAVLQIIEHSQRTNPEIIMKIIKKYKKLTKTIVMTTRENRIFEYTSDLKVLDYQTKEASNNNYSYNDAYRINTSRAHGSLKYIIIKIVLILIIVVMTIFIRMKIETDDDYKIVNELGNENGLYNIKNSESISYIY